MLDANLDPAATIVTSSPPSELFMWRGAGIILLGEREDNCLILARSWQLGDRLTHVRRWTFREPIPFSGQVRRLVMEACGNAHHAREQGLRALDWAEAPVAR